MKRVVLAFLLALPAAAQQITLRPIATGLNTPLGLVSAGDSRLFIVERGGQILIYDGTRVLPNVFLDISPLISCCDERGLLGLAFSPQYATNGFLFIDYTDRSGNITIARYKVSASDPNRADPAGQIVLTIEHQLFPNHNGGQLQFGPDGYLYIGVGDGGSGGDPFGNGQKTNVLLAKILRIDVSSLPYKVPPTNPFGNEIWAYGLRNPWRFSFDRLSGDLLIADVGQNDWEEVDFQPAGSAGGQNYGWHCFEATHPFAPTDAACRGPFTMPVLEYSHAGGACSITGGYRYHGQFARMHDIYFYGDFCTGAIFGATQRSDGTWTTRQLASMPDKNSLSSFGEDANGELYAVDLNGAVYRLVDTSAPATPKRSAQH